MIMYSPDGDSVDAGSPITSSLVNQPSPGDQVPGDQVPGDPVVVRRSAWRMWAVAVFSIPLLVAGLDLLTRRRLTDYLRAVLFNPEDTQLPEPRDSVWAVVFVMVGLGLALWGMRELIAPTRLLVADSSGLRVRLRGPFRRPVAIAWDAIEDVGSGSVDDEGTAVPVIWLRFTDPSLVPVEPWGARPLDERTLAILASDWDRPHVEVADRIAALASAPPPVSELAETPFPDGPRSPGSHSGTEEHPI